MELQTLVENNDQISDQIKRKINEDFTNEGVHAQINGTACDLSWVINESEFRTFGRKYPLPEFETIFPFKRNPFDRSALINSWMEWSFESSLMPRDKFKYLEGTTIFASYFYPFCTDIQRYENLVKYLYLLFVFDDHEETDWGDFARNSDKSKEIWGQFDMALNKLISVEHIAMNKWKPYVMAMYACFEDICSAFNQTQRNRFVDMWKLYIDGNLEESQMIHDKVELENMDQLIKVRLKSDGVYPVLQLIEYADNIFVPDQDWNDPEFQELFDLQNQLVMFINDIFSFEKEMSQNKRDNLQFYNVVTFFVRFERISISEAMQKCADISKALEITIRDKTNQMLQDTKWSKDTIVYIERSIVLMGGDWKLSTKSDRYNKYLD